MLHHVRYINAAFETVRGTMITEGERIAALSAPQPDAGAGEDLLCLPGLIDIHTHGGAGVDACDKTEDALQTLSMYYAKHGVTSWCPTTMTLPQDDLEAVFAAIERVKGKERGAYIQGINREGPYVSREKCGAQNGRGNRIGADCHPANRLNRERQAVDNFQHALADQPQTLGIESNLFAVAIVLGFLAAGENEVAKLQRVVFN